MLLTNCKIHLELNWNNNCAMYGADTYAGGDNANNRETTFQITSIKLYFPIVTLSTKDNVNLTKKLNEGFKRSVYWNEYKSKIEKKKQMSTVLKDFHKMLLFKVYQSCMCSFLMMLIMMLIEFKETVIENIFYQD